MHWKNLLIIAFASFLSMAVCIYIDYWFYGTFVFTPLNYYKFTVANGRTNMGTPWWYYLFLFLLSAIPPISIVLLIFFTMGIYKNPRNIFAIYFLTYLIIHSIFGLKEVRYLFPLSFSFIYISSLGMDFIFERYKPEKIYSFAFSALVVLNVLFLIPRSIAPASERMPFQKFLYDYSSNKKITVLCLEQFPCQYSSKLTFYRTPNINYIVLKKATISDYMTQNNLNEVLFYYHKPAFNGAFEKLKMERVFSLFPEWILRYNINNWESRTSVWSIYKITRQDENARF